MNAELITVLMPVKNAGSFLEECLDSVRAQTCQTWELIAIDDHSDDTTPAILRHYANIDRRIQVYPNEGVGIIPALRLAYARSNGNYLTRMDADDIMNPHKLATLKKLLDENGAGSLAVGGVHYFSQSSLGDGYKKYAAWLNELTHTSKNFVDIYKECVIPSPCWMVFRTDLDRCGAFNLDVYPEDYDLCFRFYKNKLKVCGTQEIIHRWRDYPQRASRTHEHYADNRFLELKLNYFLELDYNPEKELIIWGAGAKGKWLAQHLAEREIDYTWISNNSKKIGHSIYGQIIQAPKKINQFSNADIIISVANPDEQEELIAYLSEQKIKFILHKFC